MNMYAGVKTETSGNISDPRLVEALGDMLTLEPTAEQRARAAEVWQRERGVPT